MEWVTDEGKVWETLVSGESLEPSVLAKDAGLPLATTVRALARLKQQGLVELATNAPVRTYRAVRHLDAMRWAHAVSEGIPLSVLEKHVRLAPGARDEALRIASTGQVERHEKARRTRQGKKLRQMRQAKAISVAAATDLAKLVEDTRSALQQAPAKTPADLAARVVLESALAQAERALEGLQKSVLASL